MRLLTILVLAAALLWSGYWWAGATATRAAMEEALGRPGLAAGEITVTGYPNRFDTILTEPVLADGVWRWRAPELHLYALSYQPNRLIATLPPTQTLEGPGQDIEVTSERLAASLHLVPGPDLALRESVVEARALTLSSTLGWTAGVADAQLSIRRHPDPAAPANAYEADLRAEGLRPPAELRALVDRAGRLPERITPIALRLAPVFDAPLDRHAAAGEPPALTALGIERANLVWGPLAVSATGDLEVDAAGFATGTLNVEAENWREMLDLAEEAGLVPPERTEMLDRVLGAMAATTGDADVLRVALGFSGGRTRIGPIPVGPAPRLAYRQ